MIVCFVKFCIVGNEVEVVLKMGVVVFVIGDDSDFVLVFDMWVVGRILGFFEE